MYFAPLLKGFPLELRTYAGGQKNQNDRVTGPRKMFDDIYSRLNTIHQSDRRTDGHRPTAKAALTHRVATSETNRDKRLS